MEIRTNKELSDTVAQIIRDNGIKKTWIAEKLGISRQAVDNLLAKQSFSVDDANKILNLIGRNATIKVDETQPKQLTK